MSTLTRDSRRNVEDLIASLDIPVPFDIDVFVASIADQRQRRIELHRTLGSTQPCGMVASTPEVDYIYCAADVTELHAQHITLHEIGHLLFGHQGETTQPSEHTLTRQERLEALSHLMPSLPITLIERILGRTVYGSIAEHEAELFASLVLARAHNASGLATAHEDTALTRFQAVFAGQIPAGTRG